MNGENYSKFDEPPIHFNLIGITSVDKVIGSKPILTHFPIPLGFHFDLLD